MTGVQLIGTKAVLQRFEKFDADSWGLYQGRQFIVGGVGADALREWVQDFNASGSTATYTLRVYDMNEAPTCSTGNSDYLACINFKAVDEYDGYGIAGHNGKLQDRIAGIEKKIDQLVNDDRDDGDADDLNTVFMGWLNDPVKLNQVAGAIKQIMGVGPVGVPVGLPAAPVQTVGSTTDPADKEAQLTRVAAALDKLEKKDPKLVDHLERLAKLSESDPALFQAVTAKLDLL